MTRTLTQPIRGRPLPTELADALHAVKRVEQAAANRAQRSRATAATSRLLLAAVHAGWASRHRGLGSVAGYTEVSARRHADAADALRKKGV